MCQREDTAIRNELSLQSDDEALMRLEREQLWGIATTIDLYGCDGAIIRDARAIKRFAAELCDLLEIQRFGETVVIRLGSSPQVRGYSMLQFLEGSLISGHFANNSNAAYIDLFSCQPYPAHTAAAFCKEFFRAQTMKVSVTFRHERPAEELGCLEGAGAPLERAVGEAAYFCDMLDDGRHHGLPGDDQGLTP